MADDPNEIIRVRHPEIETIWECFRYQLTDLYAAKGAVELTPEENARADEILAVSVDPSRTASRVRYEDLGGEKQMQMAKAVVADQPLPDVATMTVQELEALARRKGVDPAGMKKADLVTALQGL